MARTVPQLSDARCEAAKFNPNGKNNKLSDGGGLFLLIRSSGSKSWRMKYKRPTDNKEDTLVFGFYPEVTLLEARGYRDAARALIANDIDPKAQRIENEIQKQQAKSHTFESVAREWHAERAPTLSPDYAVRLLKRMEDNLFPEIGKKPVSEIKTRDLIAPLKKIEKRNAPVIAERMKQSITGVMRHAVQNGLIDSNPALDLLGSVKRRAPVHRPALPLEQLPDFQQRLDNDTGRAMTVLAVKLTLLTFIRSSELRFARWSEIDLDKALWTIPATRKPIAGVKYSERGAKMKTPHLVPLSRQAVGLLEQVKLLSSRDTFVFAGESSSGAPVSEGTINKALQRMGYDTKTDVCGHGFRTMACGALIQSGLWQEDAVERQMSHQERNGVRQAYTHAAEFMQERRLMVQWWADYLEANRQYSISPYDFAKRSDEKVTAIKRTY